MADVTDFILGSSVATITYAYVADKDIERPMLSNLYGKIIGLEGLSRFTGKTTDIAVTNYGGILYYGIEREFSEIEISFDAGDAPFRGLRNTVATTLACGNRLQIKITQGSITKTLIGVITRLNFPVFQKGAQYRIKVELMEELYP